MFEELLNGIFHQNGLSEKLAKQHYLKALKPYGKQLWDSYQQQRVIADYSLPEIQEAYLLRYFPFYTLLVENELNGLRNRGHSLPEVEIMESCFFGCGPGPEVIGLMKHLKDARSETTMLIAKMVDVATETWSHSRKIVNDFLAEPFWEPGLLELLPIDASLSNTTAIENMHLENFQLAVIQNCLNEVQPGDQPTVIQNIMNAFSQLSPGAIALVIDRDKYAATARMLREMAQLACTDKRYERLTLISEFKTNELSCKDMLNRVPDIVDNNLYYRPTTAWSKPEAEKSGLIYANAVKYISIAFQVSQLPLDNS